MEMDYKVYHNFQDDRWRPMNHLNATDCNKFVEDMASVGIDLQSSVYSEDLLIIPRAIKD